MWRSIWPGRWSRSRSVGRRAAIGTGHLKRKMPAVLSPLDHLKELWPEKLRGAQIGAFLHPASVSAKLEHASQILGARRAESFWLRALFGPQHGFLGQTQDNMVEWNSYEHPRLGVPRLQPLRRKPRTHHPNARRARCLSHRSSGCRRALLHFRLDDVSLPGGLREKRNRCRRARSTQSHQWPDDGRPDPRSGVSFLRRFASVAGSSRPDDWRNGSSLSRGGFSELQTDGAADEGLGTGHVV